MIKKIDILGLSLDNYTVREALGYVEAYLDNNEFNMIENVTMKMLIESETDETVREALSVMNLTVIAEQEIIQAADAATMQRLQETRANNFAYEFFRRIERNHKSIFLLGETEKRLMQVKEELLEEFPKLIFVGESAVENCVGDLDAVINDMNVTTPNIIISVLPSPMQEHFLMEHKDKMNANIWYGMGEWDLQKKGHGLGHLLFNKMRMERLKTSMDRYREDSDMEAGEER